MKREKLGVALCPRNPSTEGRSLASFWFSEIFCLKRLRERVIEEHYLTSLSGLHMFTYGYMHLHTYMPHTHTHTRCHHHPINTHRDYFVLILFYDLGKFVAAEEDQVNSIVA